jgi:hypothetical protein
MKVPASASEHCSKSSWWCGDILLGSRGPFLGSRKFTMKVEQRKIRPNRPGVAATSRL